MARSRLIKPAFFTNEVVAELSPLTRIAFIGLWTLADFKGCLEMRPKRMKAQILPYDDCDFEEIVRSLEEVGLIVIYASNENRYLKIINFAKDQHPHINEQKAGSSIPDFPENALQHTDSKKDQAEAQRLTSDLIIIH